MVARSSRAVAHRYYHGRTGKVWNITKSALGVMVNKAVRGRIISKRLHVRVEHVKVRTPSSVSAFPDVVLTCPFLSGFALH